MSDRQDAIRAGRKKYHGAPCGICGLTERWVSHRGCVSCKAKKVDEWRRENPDKWAASFAAWRERNLEYDRSRSREYMKSNKDKRNSYCAKAKLSRKHRVPPWANLDAIAKVYAEAQRKSAETGVPHEVDHIYPLLGRRVSGLHVEWNLRVVTRDENRRKGNRIAGD